MLPEGYLLQQKDHASSTTYVIKQGKYTVGFLLLLKNEEEQCYWLSRLYVYKEHRHQGIGRTLIQTALLAWAPFPVYGFIQSVGKDRVGLKRLRRFYALCGAHVDENDVICWRVDAV